MMSARPLLPNEPRVIDAPRQQALTERYLLPATGPLMTLMLYTLGITTTALRQQLARACRCPTEKPGAICKFDVLVHENDHTF